MQANYIMLSTSTLALLSAECKAELAPHLGFPVAVPTVVDADVNEEELAELGIQAARAFLLGCGERTRSMLELMVDLGNAFSLRELAARADVEVGALRGVWTGLTKRTRTITGDPEVRLIDWEEKPDGDYIGRFSSTTLQAFKKALEE